MEGPETVLVILLPATCWASPWANPLRYCPNRSTMTANRLNPLSDRPLRADHRYVVYLMF